MDRYSVKGGTEVPGVAPEAFAMPPGMAIRYDRPSPALRELCTGYHVYASAGPGQQSDWFLPGTADICVFVDAPPVSASIGSRTFDALPEVSLLGPTSRAFEARTRGGILVGLGLTALGWHRLGLGSVRPFHNRFVPAADVLPRALVEELPRALARTEERDAAAVLDALMEPVMGPPTAHDDLIRGLMAALIEDGAPDVAAVAERLGVSDARLRATATRCFGLPPKQLLRRARFLRSFLRLFRLEEPENYGVIDPSYHDASHFIRDAHDFLGTTPRRFMARPTPFLDGSVRARMAVLGAPLQVLHDVGRAA